MPHATLPRPRSSSVAELVAAACTGDHGAWTEIVERYDAHVRRTVATYRLQEADSADATQNTWLRAVEQIGSLREPERLGGWLRTIAGRECIAVMRRSRAEVPVVDDAADMVADEPGPEERVLGAEARHAVGVAVGKLRGRNHQVVRLMMDFPDAGYADIARRAGVPVGSIGPTRGRALQVLRTALSTLGYGTRQAAPTIG
jgi:RNA polymerase sigma factor (sigma-70 family)